MRSNLSRSQPRLALAIRTRRADLGLTQEGAAERCGVSARFWRRLESGSVGVSFEVVERIVTGLDWSWAILGRRMASGRTVGKRSGGDGLPKAIHDLLVAAWGSSGSRDRTAITQVLKRFSQKSPKS